MNKQWAINNLVTVATCDLLCILFCAFIHIAVLHHEGTAKCNLLCPIGSHLVSWSVIPGDKISFKLRPHSHIDHMRLSLCCDISHELGGVPVPILIIVSLNSSALSIVLSLVSSGSYLILIDPWVLLAEDSWRKSIAYLCPNEELKSSWCFLFI
jgi:hypothetical protein